LGFLISPGPSGSSQPQLGALLLGFVMLMAGLAALTVRRHRHPLQSSHATRRAIEYALVYGLCSASFGRVIGGALLGQSQSPWLLALGDVIFVTFGLYIWAMALAEGYSLGDYGFRSAPPARLLLTTLMGIGAVAVFALSPYRALFAREVVVTNDTLVFALLYSTLGTAVPAEMLFRGYMMSSLDGRSALWARITIPALLFTFTRALRVGPLGVGSPDWLIYIFGVVLPLGLLWGLIRELSGRVLWPSLISHFLLEFGTTLAGVAPPTVE
jgi:membrane protease YdiL (CAAX protease family)